MPHRREMLVGGVGVGATGGEGGLRNAEQHHIRARPCTTGSETSETTVPCLRRAGNAASESQLGQGSMAQDTPARCQVALGA